MNRRIFLWVSVFVLCIVIGTTGKGFSQDESTSEVNWGQELSSDKQAIESQKNTIKENSEAARQGEEILREQIKDARAMGDTATAESLENKLKSLHQQNVQQKQTDRKALQETRQEFKGDRKAAKQEGYVPPPKPQMMQRQQQQMGQRPKNPPGYNPPGQGAGNPPGYNPPGKGAGNPPGYNPPGKGKGNPPGYNPPGKGAGNPPGYNPPGKGKGNPPGYNPPGKGPMGPKAGGPKPGKR